MRDVLTPVCVGCGQCRMSADFGPWRAQPRSPVYTTHRRRSANVCSGRQCVGLKVRIAHGRHSGAKWGYQKPAVRRVAKLQEFRTSGFSRANVQPVAGFRGRPVGKTACHCGDWKAPPCPIVIGLVSPLRSSISSSDASWGEAPLSPGPPDENQQPTNGGARASSRHAGLAGIAFTGAAPDVSSVVADNSTGATSNRCIGCAFGGFYCWGSAGRGNVGAACRDGGARRADCSPSAGSASGATATNAPAPAGTAAAPTGRAAAPTGRAAAPTGSVVQARDTATNATPPGRAAASAGSAS